MRVRRTMRHDASTKRNGAFLKKEASQWLSISTIYSIADRLADFSAGSIHQRCTVAFVKADFPSR
jgi:hypothetical protein